ncbi:hypothetical protein P7K49_030307 [Saguinus oedipus]|uniref:Leucine-rich repeat-containing protein 2 n=1 Tax=Saguinus oedipus TaxID=9490 RepID=A0ABQ9U1U8_SAGOE|nr:hypothetical protein P7K49_030307 [Saguinus oedipus]
MAQCSENAGLKSSRLLRTQEGSPTGDSRAEERHRSYRCCFGRRKATEVDLDSGILAVLSPGLRNPVNLKELNVSFNQLKSIPPELGDCENLDRLDCSGNVDNLKQVTFVDISANKFSSVPICVLRMSNLQWLDISNNNLTDLPQDIDRLEELQSFLLYKNKLTYLPYSMLNLKKLTLLVVSGDHLVELPTALCDSSTPLK